VASADSRIDPLENRPLSDRTREVLLAAIHTDKFPDGRLPPEAELAELLGVSRTTLRAALQSLSADGLITRRRRHGTVINAHLLRSSMRLNRLVAFTTLIEQCGHVASVDPQESRVGDEGLEVRRLLRAGGAPVITVTDVVPLENLKVDVEQIGPAETTFEFLAAYAVAPVDYATTEFVPRIAAPGNPAGLEIAAGTPYIELHETHFSREHEPIALSVVCVDDSLVRLSMLRRGL
jgi:GntR family transcriptional regulator